MIDFFGATLVFILRVLDFVFEIWRLIENAWRLARWGTGSDKLVEVPPDPKILPPAAQRALAEAEERRSDT